MSRPLQVYETERVTVTFNPSRCIHNAHCVRTLPSVFNTAARPWVQPDNADAETVLRVVAGCPTGALHAALRDGPSADATVITGAQTVAVMRNGPLFVRGALQLVDGDDQPLAADARMALCRCGLSKQKPFCDNSHRAAGWTDTPPTP